jgi:Integron Cassette Protein Hfx_Cass5
MNPASKQVAIAAISVDAAGRLLVKPALSKNADFNFIYRAAMEVSWDSELRSFSAPAPRAWSRADWFKKIVAAAKGEYGVQLCLSPDTQWSNVAAEDKQEIEAYSKQA